MLSNNWVSKLSPGTFIHCFFQWIRLLTLSKSSIFVLCFNPFFFILLKYLFYKPKNRTLSQNELRKCIYKPGTRTWNQGVKGDASPGYDFSRNPKPPSGHKLLPEGRIWAALLHSLSEFGMTILTRGGTKKVWSSETVYHFEMFTVHERRLQEWQWS